MIEELIYNGNLKQLKEISETKGIEVVKNNSNIHDLASIHIAAQIGNIEIVRFLIEESVRENPNLPRINNFTPMHAAAMNGHVEIVNYLIELNCKLNIQTDPQGYAPIHSASFGGHVQTVKLLVENGADITLRNYREEKPIDTAKRQNQKEVVNYLLSIKNDV